MVALLGRRKYKMSHICLGVAGKSGNIFVKWVEVVVVDGSLLHRARIVVGYISYSPSP